MLSTETITTSRLLLRRPSAADAPAIYVRYSSDLQATRWLNWPRHRQIEETLRFVDWSHQQWAQWPAGPLLIFERDPLSQREARLAGATGLSFDSPHEATVGYVLAPDCWGRGYATEALRAMVVLARQLGVRRLSALCHAEHTASAHVLEKCEFTQVDLLERHILFPNLAPGVRMDVLRFALTL
jgi:[ribosomal protein S5]-alanine N-acetyltransferase